MERRFLDSGRVVFLPRHLYAEGTATSLLTGQATRLVARRRIVDATNADTRIPATHPPAFPVAPGARLVTPGGLAAIDRPAKGYVVIGAGKTAVDTVLWLLSQDVDADAIRWIRPRDSWCYNRRQHQTDPRLIVGTVSGAADQMEATAGAMSLADLFLRLEACGAFLRIDPDVEPEMFHCANVSLAELADLRRITRVIRMGRVQAIETDRILLERGEIPIGPDQVCVHCAASGVPVRPVQPIFRSDRILLQFVQHCTPLFSAALIGWLEARRSDDAARNRLAEPVPMVDRPADWLACRLADARNWQAWEGEADLSDWILRARLDGFMALFASAADPASPAHDAFLRHQRAEPAGMARIAALLAAL